MVKRDEQQGFNQLCFNRRAFHNDKRLHGEHRRSFLNRPNIAVKLKMAQIV